MKSFGILVFLLSATTAFGATLKLNRDIKPRDINILSNSTPDSKSEDDNIVEYDPVTLSPLSVANPENIFAMGKTIAEIARMTFDFLAKVDFSSQSLKDLVKLLMPLLSTYLGPYTQVIVPMLSGIATVFFKSLAR